MSPQEFADKLVDWVATVTQLDPEKGELPNVEDWRRNAEKLFVQSSVSAAALRAAREALEEAVEHHCGCVEEYMIGDTKIPAHTCTYCVALAALGGEAKP